MPAAESRTAMVLLCYAGAPGSAVADADAAIEPLLELGTVASASITERRYAEILEDAQHPPGVRLVSRNTLMPALDDDAIEAVAGLSATGAPLAIAIRSLGGAVARVPSDATAFAHRDAEAMVVCGMFLPAAATDEDVESAVRPWRTVAALGTGPYINFQGSATDEDVAAAYPPETYARLAAVKRSYDPGNLFALNHNIEPASAERVEGPAA